MTEEEQRVLKYLAHRYRHYNYDQSDAVKRVAHLLERFTLEEQQTGSSQLPVFKADPQQLQFLRFYPMRSPNRVKYIFITETMSENGNLPGVH